jgi:hypothetical protein
VTSYNTDVIAWANEQAAFIRSGRFELLDIEHIADEIEDVGKSEKREIKSRMVILLSHLLKWERQSERQGNSWRKTINVQRRDVAGCLRDTPSLKPDLQNKDWFESVWAGALDMAVKETGLSFDAFPEECPWSISQIFDENFWPDLGATQKPQ